MIVYLDSNIYIDADYVFDREEFLTLRDLMRKGKLEILYTIDTAGRVNEQIETDIRRAASTYNRYLRKYMGPFRKNENYGIREISADAAVDDIQADFRKLLAEEGMVQIPLDPVSADRLISDYYGGQPPFENKRSLGFRDAIVINALRNYARAKDLICVVSKDEEFRNAFAEDRNFLPFSTLDGFIRFLQETQDELVDLSDKLKEIIGQGQMNEGIEKYIYSLDIVRECEEDCLCRSTSIEDVDCYMAYIEEQDDKLYAVINTVLYISAEVIYIDKDRSYYDEDTREYLIENYRIEREYHEVPRKVRAVCICNEPEGERKTLRGYKIVHDKINTVIDLTDETMYKSEEVKDQ